MFTNQIDLQCHHTRGNNEANHLSFPQKQKMPAFKVASYIVFGNTHKMGSFNFCCSHRRLPGSCHFKKKMKRKGKKRLYWYLVLCLLCPALLMGGQHLQEWWPEVVPILVDCLVSYFFWVLWSFDDTCFFTYTQRVLVGWHWVSYKLSYFGKSFFSLKICIWIYGDSWKFCPFTKSPNSIL